MRAMKRCAGIFDMRTSTSTLPPLCNRGQRDNQLSNRDGKYRRASKPVERESCQ